MTKKAIMMGVIISLILAMPAYGFTAKKMQAAIVLDNAKIEACAYIFGGDIYLPLRAVGEALGYEIQWSEKDKTVSVSKTGKNIMIDMNNDKITVDDHVCYMSGDYSGKGFNGGTTIGDRVYMRTDFFSDNFGLKVQWDGLNGIIQLESVIENAISIKTVKEASETDKIKVTLQYPQVDGLADKTVQDSINSIFEKSATDARNEGLKNAEEMEKVVASGYTGTLNKCETYFDYRLKYNQNGLLSVVFMDYQYAGGAHGLMVQSSHTFDLKTGEEYRLKDLVKSDADYVSLINNTVRNEINNRVKEGMLSENAPFKTIKDEQDFYLSNNAVVVYFQQYEYWPYAAGIQEFPVEFSALKEMLKHDFGFLNDNVKEQTRPEDIENGMSGEGKLFMAINKAGIQLLQKISVEEEGQNTILSPVSVSTMLAVLANGAAGKTRAEISAIINPEQLPAKEMNEKYRDTINNLIRSGYEENGKKTTLVELANSLWIQENLRVKDGFLKDAKTYYEADAYNVNFADDSAVSAMNRWIEDKTHNKIQNYLSEVSPQTAMVAFSSLYFNGKWQSPFDKSKTQKEDFQLSDGSTVKVDMMNAERRIGYYEDDQIQAGSFNYYGCSMLVILPKSSTGAYLPGVGYAEVNKALSNLENMKVKIKFPKFNFAQKNDLVSHLKSMGLDSAFDSGSADFTGIADRSAGFNLYISDISQKCTISVDEEGTEAAALTSVVLAGSSMPRENTPPEFYLNKPFIFVIRDDRTGLILFIGKVKNPLDHGRP
ncbi:Anti-sigma-V factor RsiV [Pelotomaculum schinkii]|uniref:Anti-sigma-V factor RsiV n=1 Tax=Pelotomaculum schinkii TaxID=78350 RepID=A0A4Y7RG71_9FIRM|nr:serpin family protein [Pelotomaculum schinkii]TEB07692.1 Anti-sigma-V factor RsiV [Pelotomaculum schinkii]